MWEGLYYFDTVLAMGHRIVPYICQRVTSAIRHVHTMIGLFLLNYVDDFVGAERKELTQFAYDRLGWVLEQVGLPENKSKAVPPSHTVEFLGVTFNSKTMTMEVSGSRLQELDILLQQWLKKFSFVRKDLESLIGKLQFVAACVRPGRVFICRLLNVLRQLNNRDRYHVCDQMRKDELVGHISSGLQWHINGLVIPQHGPGQGHLGGCIGGGGRRLLHK